MLKELHQPRIHAGTGALRQRDGPGGVGRAVNIDEGTLDDDFGGRRWQVQVRSVDEAVKAAAQQKERARDGKRRAKLDGLKAKLRQALRELPGGETVTRLAQLVGESRTTGVAEALAELREDGEVVLGEVVKQAGRRKQTLPAWRPNRPIDALLEQVKRNRSTLAAGADAKEEDGVASSLERSADAPDATIADGAGEDATASVQAG